MNGAAGAKGAPSFVVAVSRLPQDGLQVRFEADEAQRAVVAARLGILGLDRFEADLLVGRWRQEGVSVEGTLRAVAVQTDVVTLDPVRQPVEEEVQLFFVPDTSRLAAPVLTAEGALDLDPGDETIEVFRGDRIELGEPLVQILGLGLDPYPRGEAVAFEAEPDGEPEPSPFAMLARLREPKGN